MNRSHQLGSCRRLNGEAVTRRTSNVLNADRPLSSIGNAAILGTTGPAGAYTTSRARRTFHLTLRLGAEATGLPVHFSNKRSASWTRPDGQVLINGIIGNWLLGAPGHIPVIRLLRTWLDFPVYHA